MLSQGLGRCGGPDAELLLLGSFPGQNQPGSSAVLRASANSFWPLVAALIQQPDLTQLPMPSGWRPLKQHRVAPGMWWTAAAGQPGQRHPRGNPDPACRPGGAAAPLRAIGCNGGLAHRQARVTLPACQVPLIALPSSSPAMASLSFAAKRERWLALLAPLRS